MKNLRIILLSIAVAGFALPMFAQSTYQMMRPIESEPEVAWADDTSYNTGQYLDNPCTYVVDYVWVNYSAYVEGAQKEATANRYLFAETTNMGGMYAAAGTSRSDVDYGAAVALRQYHKVNTPDNFHVVTVVNFDPASKSTRVTMETACGNGMPDSKE